MWGVFEVFVDTIVVCTCTALVILTTGVIPSGKEGVDLTIAAFATVMGDSAGVVVSIALFFFAFSTIIGWSYYCLLYTSLSQVFDYLLESEKNYDAFCVFDADNLVDKNFLLAMNDSCNCGSNIAQGFRDAKNPHDSWISGSYAVYYYCVNSFMSKARRAIGMSAYINGTGFMVSSRLIRKLGFNTYTLTEDNEYSCLLYTSRCV